jgi:hypothetical protein
MRFETNTTTEAIPLSRGGAQESAAAGVCLYAFNFQPSTFNLQLNQC